MALHVVGNEHFFRTCDSVFLHNEVSGVRGFCGNKVYGSRFHANPAKVDAAATSIYLEHINRTVQTTCTFWHP